MSDKPQYTVQYLQRSINKAQRHVLQSYASFNINATTLSRLFLAFNIERERERERAEDTCGVYTGVCVRVCEWSNM